jgi:hypothetical protein
VCYTIRSARRGEKGTSDVSTDIARTMLGVGVCVCMRMRVTVCHFPQPTFQAMTSRHDDDRSRADETRPSRLGLTSPVIHRLQDGRHRSVRDSVSPRAPRQSLDVGPPLPTRCSPTSYTLHRMTSRMRATSMHAGVISPLRPTFLPVNPGVVPPARSRFVTGDKARQQIEPGDSRHSVTRENENDVMSRSDLASSE